VSAVAEEHVTFDELRREDQWRFVWGFFWRSMCATVVATLGGAVAGGLIGFVVGIAIQLMGKSFAGNEWQFRILGGLIGFVIGFIVLWQLIRWLFHVRWFGYRLRLVRDVV
jgi:ABC-type methionine transport system permease subunit